MMPGTGKSTVGFTVDDVVHIQFVRHGQKSSDTSKLFTREQKRRDESMRDAPISECGIKQAEALAGVIGTSKSAMRESTLIVA